MIWQYFNTLAVPLVSLGAMLSHGNIIASVTGSSLADGEKLGLFIAPCLSTISSGLVYVCANFAGSHSVLIPTRNLDDLLDVMKSFKFTGFAAVNTILVGLMASEKFDAVDWSNKVGRFWWRRAST